MTPTSVLFAIPELDHGGPDRVVFELLESLDRTRIQPSLMVSKPGGYYFARLPSDIEVRAARSSIMSRYPIVPALRVVRELAPDVVFATLRMALTLGIASAAFPKKTRLILRQANDLSADFAILVRRSLIKHRFARMLSIASLKHADAVVCQSHNMRHDLERVLGEPQTKLHVISNPIDIEKTRHLANARPVQLEGAPSLVSVGRLSAQKGFDILLPAIAQLRSRHPQLHLTIFGDGEDRSSLEAQARRLGVEGCVSFRGFEADPLPYIRAANLFVLASRYEGFPNAALEALACGTAVVLTNCPGANSEIVLDGVNGRLAKDLTSASVADAIDLAIRERGGYDSSRIMSDCAERFSTDRIVNQYADLIASIGGRQCA